MDEEGVAAEDIAVCLDALITDEEDEGEDVGNDDNGNRNPEVAAKGKEKKGRARASSVAKRARAAAKEVMDSAQLEGSSERVAERTSHKTENMMKGWLEQCVQHGWVPTGVFPRTQLRAWSKLRHDNSLRSRLILA